MQPVKNNVKLLIKNMNYTKLVSHEYLWHSYTKLFGLSKAQTNSGSSG